MAVKRRRKAGVITNIRPGDENHQVVTITGATGGWKRTPCPECPWRVENVGTFPAEVFVASAATAYDVSERLFACHMSRMELAPDKCAGFLLKGATHNIAVRLALAKGEIDPDKLSAGGANLHASYREMAEANGVRPDHPALAPCRANDD